ncbi:MAG TPA: hypothetical protein VG754_08745 [Verrucomicrobiae bacterium]|nr:hypothetical protein [Verrucomicrobiae bacterium]
MIVVMRAFENKMILTDAAGKKNPTREILFTPCTTPESLLEAVTMAAQNALPEDVLLLSSACSNFDQFRNHQRRMEPLPAAASRMPSENYFVMQKNEPAIFDLLRGFSEEKTPARKTKQLHSTSQERTLSSAKAK